jgi:poly(A) polymerase
MRFFGHAEVGAGMAGRMLERWRCSRRAVWHVSKMVEQHLRPSLMAPTEHDGPPTSRAIYRYWRDLAGVAADTLFLSMADYLAARGPDIGVKEWTDFAGRAGVILAGGFVSPRATKPFLLLSGGEIMAELSLSPGPRVGELLAALREAEAEGKVQTREQAFDFIRGLAEGPGMTG